MKPVTGIIAVVALALQVGSVQATLEYDPDGLVRVDTRVTADSVTVGERFGVVHAFSYPDSLAMMPPEKVAFALAGLFVLLKVGDRAEGKIKAAIRRHETGSFANVPLSGNTGGVSRLFQVFRQRGFIPVQPEDRMLFAFGWPEVAILS